MADALVDEFLYPCSRELDDEAAALEVDEAEELAGDTGASAAHDRAFLDAGIFVLELFDELPEHGCVGGGHQGFLRSLSVVVRYVM